MRVIIYEPTGKGGICHYTYQLAEALASLNLHITVSTSDTYELENFDRNFHVHYHSRGSFIKILLRKLSAYNRNHIFSQSTSKNCDNDIIGNSGRAHYLAVFQEIFSLLKRWHNRLRLICFFIYSRASIIHFQWLTHPAEDLFLVKILRSLGFQTVYTAHNILPHDNTSLDIKKIFSKIYGSVDHIIVHAERNKSELINDFNVDTNKISVIHHGSYDFFRNENSMLNRNEIGIPRDKRVILFFGAIRKYKGLDYLIDAFQEVKKKIHDAFLLIVGDFKRNEEDHNEYYAKLLKKIRSSKDTIFIRKYIDAEQVGQFLTLADIVALPYTNVYQSGVLMLALTYGKPTVVSDVGGLSEVVQSGKTGYVVPPGNSIALANAIVKLLSNDEERKLMGLYAKKIAETVYSWENAALKTQKLYQCLSIEKSLMENN